MNFSSVKSFFQSFGGKRAVQIKDASSVVAAASSSGTFELGKMNEVTLKSGERRNHKKVGEHRGGKPKKLSISEHFIRFTLSYMERPSKFLAGRVPNLTEDILKSNLNISPEGIISVSIFFTLLSVPIAVIGILLLLEAHLYLETLALFVLPFLPILIGLNIPKISASSRGSALENELPYLIGYITVLAGGGISPFVTIKRIARADSIFPAAANEARRIQMDIELFGHDAMSALEKAAHYMPNRKFADFLDGYISVLKAGGDSLGYLESKLKDIFVYREIKIKASSELIGTLAETYIIATVVMGISFFILFLTENLLTTSSVGGVNSTMILMFTGVFVPVISVVFVMVVNSAQIREPFSYNLQYYAFLGCIPFGVIFFLLPLPLPQYIQLGLALALVSTPPMILNIRYSKQKKAVESKLANFLRDMSEVRKTGLAPEKTIEQLSGRNYAGLSIHVKKISTQLSWGVPIRSVFENFIHVVRSWVTRAVTFLLLEVVDVGGGSPKMFVSLADFTERYAQLEKERKSQVRPYVIIPYVGAILVVVTTALMVYLLSGPGLSVGSGPNTSGFLASPEVVSQATNLLLTASFFQAWTMGIVAGKMGEGSVGDGFKHATVLVIICIITVLITRLFVQI